MEPLEIVVLIFCTALVTVITALVRRRRRTPTEVSWYGERDGGKYEYDDTSDRTEARPFDRVL